VSGSRQHVDANGLIAQLQTADGALTISDPPTEIRASYRRAISAAIVQGAVPAGMLLRHTGRDRGDLVIRLVPVEGSAARHVPPAPVPVPDGLHNPHRVVEELSARKDHLTFSERAWPRALRLVQAHATEAELRGYDFALAPDNKAGFRISIGEDHFDFVVSEEADRREIVTREDAANAKYSWQRLTPEPNVPSGRLVLETTDGWRTRRWADRKRWSLDGKLPEALAFIEERAASAAASRDAARRQVEARRQQWEEAVPRARQRYLADLNQRRVLEQASAWKTAGSLRDFAAALGATASPSDAAISAWAAWAEEQADAIDPLRQRGGRAFLQPDQIASEELDRFMPQGMTVRYPSTD
jgi:hypothetical protein